MINRKLPKGIPKGLGSPIYREPRTLGIPKDRSSGNTPQSDTALDKTPQWKRPSFKQPTHVSPTFGDSSGHFQPIHLCSGISACAKGGIMGTFSHVSAHIYLHVTVHVAEPQLDYVSLLPSLTRQPSRHSKAFYQNHLGLLSGEHFPNIPKSSLICETIIT